MKAKHVITFLVAGAGAVIIYDQLARSGYVPKLIKKKAETNPVATNNTTTTTTPQKPLTVKPIATASKPTTIITSER